MKFQTPELFARINAASMEESDLIDDEWEAAIAASHVHYARIREQLPPRLREFVEGMCLHDAEFMGMDVTTDWDRSRPLSAVVTVRQDRKIVCLVYHLRRRPESEFPVESDAFLKDPPQVDWLYDEIDLVSDGLFCHEILLNTGEVVRLTFYAFDFRVFHVPADVSQNGLRSPDCPGSVPRESSSPKRSSE